MAELSAVHAALRRPFPPEQIGKLPRGRTELDYVGHADVTSRLLEADPEWNWEPLSRDVDLSALAGAYDPEVIQSVIANSPPKFDLDKAGNPVGLWIRLTVAGVSRLGYGSCPSTQNDAVKVLIGDALRNAAMRFGVALDLWAKGDRADPTAENPSGSAGQAARAKPDLQELVGKVAGITSTEELRRHWEKVGAAGMLRKQIAHPGTGEAMTFQDYLTSHGEELSHKSGANGTQAASRPSAGAK